MEFKKSALIAISVFILASATGKVLAGAPTDECTLADQYRVELNSVAKIIASNELSDAERAEAFQKMFSVNNSVVLHRTRCLKDSNIDPGFACQIAAQTRAGVQSDRREMPSLLMGMEYAADQAGKRVVLEESQSLCPISFGV